MEKASLLQLSNLNISFRSEEGSTTAVNDISLEIAPGETLGIVGESGSGKSVTSLAIMRLLPTKGCTINSGKILYRRADGLEIDLLQLNEHAMRNYRGQEIAMIFQEPMTSLNPVHRCGEQVSEVITLHEKLTRRQAREKTLALFAEVLLPRPEDIYKAYPHQLSGGQKQRVMIAMAISCRPSLLIADEPTTALDVTVQKTILALLKSLQQKYGMGIIFISHDLGVVAEIADKVAVMFKGQIVEQGNIAEVFQHAQHPYTQGLLACRPPLDKRLRVLPTVGDFVNGKITSSNMHSLEVSAAERSIFHRKLYSQKPLLEVKNLQTHFPIRQGIFSRIKRVVKAVDNVSFVVYPGETLGLVGESGSGKTTLGRSILRLVEPTRGEMFYGGRQISSLTPSEMRPLRRKLQIIFQDPYSSLNPRITAGRAIMEPMNIHKLYGDHKQRKEKTYELLQKVGLLPEHFSRYPHEFSGGQRQRICIARALATAPEFIICDESVSALDVSVQAQVLNLLNELKREFGFTYIFISHDLSVVKFMSDRMMVMKDGNLLEIGEADQVYAHPQSDYTRALIGAIPAAKQI
jgi:ATPase components of various ABC-type transport systems, contain duplicated ATPase